MTLSYRIYGLYLSSDFPIPGLEEETDRAHRPDLLVQFGSEPPWVRDALSLPSLILQSIAASPETQDPAFVLTSFGEWQFFQLAYSDGTRFVVNSTATHIWGTAGESQTMEDLSTYFLGPIMGFILRRRGITALHASAFCLDGKAIVLTGEAGSGKSTTAAALALRGLPVLCEDIAAVEEKDGSFAVQTGYARVCLWPESVEILKGHPDALPRLSPNWEKCYLPLDGATARLETQKRPFGAIYILSPREAAADAPRIEEVSNREVLLELVQNTYMNWLLDRSNARRNSSCLHTWCRTFRCVALCLIVIRRASVRCATSSFADARCLLANQMSSAHSAGR